MRRPAVPMVRPATPPASYDDVPALAPDDGESSATRGQDVMAGRGKIQMKCPACGRRMELDEGFAGSVCRCAHCSALITVPHGGDETEALVPSPTRPDVPLDMRAGSPASSGSGKSRRRARASAQDSAGPAPDQAASAVGELNKKDDSIAGLLALAQEDAASVAVQAPASSTQMAAYSAQRMVTYSLSNWLFDWRRSWWAWLGGIGLGLLVLLALAEALS